MIPYKIENLGKELSINYFGNLFEYNYETIEMYYSFDESWSDTKITEMKKSEDGFRAKISFDENEQIYFCFTCEDGTWDSNFGKNYTVNIADIEPNTTIVAVEPLNNVQKITVETIYTDNIKDNNEITNNNLNNIQLSSEEPIKKDEVILKDRGTLLISEVKGKIFLPYKVEEIEKLIEDSNNPYKTAQEVIDNVFTKPFNEYRLQFSARFRECIELITKRENMSYLDGLNLASELMGKKYLHPAIISACKNLDELNVYLDCLDKDELDDFKVFNIEYEITPILVGKRYSLTARTNILKRMINFIKRILSKTKMIEN